MNIKNLSNSLPAGAALGLATALNALSPQVAQAEVGAVIFNNADPSLASVALGVNDAGHLNFSDPLGFSPVNAGATGLSYRFPDGTWRDATSPGCLCEGWGVAVTDPFGSRVAGWVNQSSGSGGLKGGTFGSTTTTASSFIQLADYPVDIGHFYGVSLVPNVFQGNVTITNSGTETVTDVVYRRVMDWDVPATEFNEYVSHFGVESNLESAGGKVRFASNNGFASSDPRWYPGEIFLSDSSINVDFFQKGPADHGSVFDFAFGDLAPGESRTFNIFYGAAANLADAQAAIEKLKPDVWSFGQSTNSSYIPPEEPVDLSEEPVAPEEPVDLSEEPVDLSEEPVDLSEEPVAPEEPVDLSIGLPVVEEFAPDFWWRWKNTPADDLPTFLFAFGGVGGVEPGITPGEQVLPFVPAPGEFIFPAPTPPDWSDPPFVPEVDDYLGSGEFFSVKPILLELKPMEGSLVKAGPLTMKAVPEPNSLLGLVALGTLGAASTLKRKLKPSQSTTKETTKVG
jgi:hypothetical protein